ncbi:MAG: efflux RND transporter permease subunit, partial [Myxococcales bacterium]|nr:efflux RND transporter permease subunit [Myxococcales bacterium]
MWLVRMALKRPYTFVVMAMLIVILGAVTLVRMPTDIFPEIDIPVISVIWNYAGLAPEEMERRVVNNFERNLTTTVNDIEHIESQSLSGVAVIKIFFQEGAKIEAATAQVTAVAQTAVRFAPPGTTPPLVIRYSASNVPIMQIALEGSTLSEQQLFDYGTNFIRADIATIQGAQLPWPYGGKQRQIMIDIDPQRLYAWGLSPRDVNAAIGLQNVIVPTGTAKIGAFEYPIVLNASPEALEQIASIPIKVVRGTTVFVRDVANVRDGYANQTNIVHVEGKKSVLLSILKHGSASTLEVARRVRETIPTTLARLPQELKVTLLSDQSVFVRAAVTGVLKEAAIAAGLTAILLLVFLGSWRSTVIVLVSIPLSILVAVIGLSMLGETLNVMTLGGMALAVGILVDDATVEIENVHRNLAKNKPIVRAILDGAAEIATPAFVSTLCICIVFVPVVFIAGSARASGMKSDLAVVIAMTTSYFLSRTLVPTMMHYLLARETGHHAPVARPRRRSWTARFLERFERGFESLRTRYGRALAWALEHRELVVIAFVLFTAGSVALLPLAGRDFFPSVDAGLIKLHVRGVPGTRIEETERKFAQIEDAIHAVIPPAAIDKMLDNIGIPYSGINLSLSEGALVSPADGEIFISLKEGGAPTAGYVRKLRAALGREFPDQTFFFLAPDISTQV